MKNNDTFKNSKTKSTDKPWRDDSGKLRSDEIIRVMASQWPPSTWEAFLADTELGENMEKDAENEVPIGDPTGDERFSTDNSLKTLLSDLNIRHFPQIAQVLRAIISKLSPAQRAVVRLYFWEGLTQVQVGEKVGITQQTVSTHLDRAIVKIRSQLLEAIKNDVASKSVAKSPECRSGEDKRQITSIG